MKHYNLNDRPAFVQIVKNTESPTINGYTLRIDIANHSVSIINLRKGGNKSMIKQVRKAKKSFEGIYEQLLEMEANLEEEVRKLVEEKRQEIEKMIEDCTEVEEVEVADEEDVTDEIVDTEESDSNGISF